ncbi:TetR family transcriptional regulator [Planomicrobium soli]|uniref:TetR family transcriptional regulator n=1 Tax=Planomicrobium soli TaxID=1176648 RepID=A0A2P8GQM2_9BACL|nr:TetR/AcrR family transcriptional regulator C-terminal domain-containing protein [Planomicrobium soli]PSL36247.1 TetR family transcriptional regulator [Planomicrobium soli]
MKKTDLRVVKTKEALKEALVFLLKEKSLKSISITEICSIAKVNRGTFYSHYEHVEDLFEDYYKDIMKDLTDSYLEPYKHVQILDTGQLNPATIRIFHHIAKYEKFYKIVFSKTAPLSYYYLLLEHIQQLMEKDFGSLSPAEEDRSMLSAYQANAIIGLAVEWHRQDFRQSAEEMNRILVRLLRYTTG